MDALLQVLRDNVFVLLFSLVFSAAVGWFLAYLLVDFVADIATKHGRAYLKHEFHDARNVGAAVFVWLILFILATYVLGLETWVRGRATMFVTVFALTIAICGWRAFRSNGVPFNVMFVAACVSTGLSAWWWLLDKVGDPHATAMAIQAAILIFLNPVSLYWVLVQYRDPDRWPSQ